MTRMQHPYPAAYSAGVDQKAKHGIYRWDLDGIGVYIGQFTRPRRPTSHYTRNVNRWLAGKPYRANNPDGWRVIHKALRLAHEHGRSIKLTIVENCPAQDLNAREAELIRAVGTLNGPRGRITLMEAEQRLLGRSSGG